MYKTLFLRTNKRSYLRHPVFRGVRISKLASKADNQSLGVSILEIAPGAEVSHHHHDDAVDSIYVLQGEGKALVNGGWERIRQGDYILVPEKIEHAIINTGEEPLRLFIVHAPPLF